MPWFTRKCPEKVKRGGGSWVSVWGVSFCKDEDREGVSMKKYKHNSGMLEFRVSSWNLKVVLSFVVVQSLSGVWLFATWWTAACQASLSFIISWSLLRLMFIELILPSNHLILCHPLLLTPSVFPSIRVFSSESVLHIRWPKYWNFSFSISPLIQDWFSLGLTGLISLLSNGLSRVFFNTTVQKHQFFSAQLSLWSNSHIHTWLLEKP